MRISDWSSDVCSSDLAAPARVCCLTLWIWKGYAGGGLGCLRLAGFGASAFGPFGRPRILRSVCLAGLASGPWGFALGDGGGAGEMVRFRAFWLERSEERRVGKECVRTCRYRGGRG